MSAKSLVSRVGALVQDRTLGPLAILAALIVCGLLLVGVAQRPSSLGTGLLGTDILLVSGYGAFAFWVLRQTDLLRRAALVAGAQIALILSIVLVASHSLEWFAPTPNHAVNLARGAGSTLLMLGLLATAGSVAWTRTGSVAWATLAGVWCGCVAVLILLSFALSLDLMLAERAKSVLHDAFLASGMSNADAFVVRNALEASSEVMIRMPIAAVVLASFAALASVWLLKWPRPLVVLAAWCTPLLLATGAMAIWYSGQLVRSARPPFVMTGVLLAGGALCVVHPLLCNILGASRRVSRAPPA